MISAAFAYEQTMIARERSVQRDDIFEIESLIRMRADAGWFTLTIMPFSSNHDRAEYVAMLLKQHGYGVVPLSKGGTYGLDIDWYTKDI